MLLSLSVTFATQMVVRTLCIANRACGTNSKNTLYFVRALSMDSLNTHNNVYFPCC